MFLSINPEKHVLDCILENKLCESPILIMNENEPYKIEPYNEKEEWLADFLLDRNKKERQSHVFTYTISNQKSESIVIGFKSYSSYSSFIRFFYSPKFERIYYPVTLKYQNTFAFALFNYSFNFDNGFFLIYGGIRCDDEFFEVFGNRIPFFDIKISFDNVIDVIEGEKCKNDVLFQDLRVSLVFDVVEFPLVKGRFYNVRNVYKTHVGKAFFDNFYFFEKFAKSKKLKSETIDDVVNIVETYLKTDKNE